MITDLFGWTAVACGFSAIRFLFESPLARIKLLLQLQPGIPELSPKKYYKGYSDCIRRVFREQGFLSLWRGANLAFASYTIFTIWSVYTWEYMHAKFYKYKNCDDKYYFLGAFIATSHIILTHPLETIRTKQAIDLGRSFKERKRINEHVIEIWRANGIKGFYRGAWLAFPAQFVLKGVFFAIYYRLKEIVNSDSLAIFISTSSLLLYYPIDTVMGRMMISSGKLANTQRSQEEKFKNSFDCAYKMFRKDGLKSFYGGSLLCLIGWYCNGPLFGWFTQYWGNYKEF